jgi:hypothetical protein
LNDTYFKRADEKKDKKKAEGEIFAEKKVGKMNPLNLLIESL